MPPIHAEFVAKGIITRLALFFEANRERTFNGSDVARILLTSWQGYERSQGQRFLGQAAHLGATEGNDPSEADLDAVAAGEYPIVPGAGSPL
jgi:hypothetical protein